MSDPQTRQTPLRRRRAPRPWRWIATGAILGFALLGGWALFTPNKDTATGAAYTATTTVGFMGIFGAFLGALVAAFVLALVVGRDRD